LIGFLLTVGPGEGFIAVEALEAILKHYPASKTWVRDDATNDGTFEQLQQIADSNPDRIDLVRNPSSLGFAGIPVSIFRSYARISEAPEELEMVIQLDPDVWLQGGIDEFARMKFDAEGPGIIGSYMRHPAQIRRSHWRHTVRMLMDLLPIGIDRSTGAIRAGFPFYSRFLSSAFKNGYRLGHHFLASLYIVHGQTLRELHKIGFWTSIPEAGARNVKEDDPLVSLGPFIIGHKLIELHDEHEMQFWIQARGPLPLTAEEIYSKYLAVHPLKSDPQALQTRRELRELATADREPKTSAAPLGCLNSPQE
jgi:hypothetical protein